MMLFSQGMNLFSHLHGRPFPRENRKRKIIRDLESQSDETPAEIMNFIDLITVGDWNSDVSVLIESNLHYSNSAFGIRSTARHAQPNVLNWHFMELMPFTWVLHHGQSTLSSRVLEMFSSISFGSDMAIIFEHLFISMIQLNNSDDGDLNQCITRGYSIQLYWHVSRVTFDIDHLVSHIDWDC